MPQSKILCVCCVCMNACIHAECVRIIDCERIICECVPCMRGIFNIHNRGVLSLSKKRIEIPKFYYSFLRPEQTFKRLETKEILLGLPRIMHVCIPLNPLVLLKPKFTIFLYTCQNLMGKHCIKQILQKEECIHACTYELLTCKKEAHLFKHH